MDKLPVNDKQIDKCKGNSAVSKILSTVKLMRIHHYVKNFLIFMPLFCSGKIFDIHLFKKTFIGFISFCLLSSVVYIINDILDRDKDRRHKTKCRRPIASGEISVKFALSITAVLCAGIILCAAGIFSIKAVGLIFLYFILNLAYSIKLKTLPIIDICIIVTGFLIRLVYGAVIGDITISNWLYLTVIAASFYFALGKRRNELKSVAGATTRNVLMYYTVDFLDKNMYMYLALTNVFYALWSVDEKTLLLHNNKSLIYTVPIVFLITMKYCMDVEGSSDADPIEVLVHDKILIFLCSVYAVIMFILLYAMR